MTRQYRIQRTVGRPDWNKIERALIDRRLWKPCGQISAYAQLAFDDSRLYVHLHADSRRLGRDIRAALPAAAAVFPGIRSVRDDSGGISTNAAI